MLVTLLFACSLAGPAATLSFEPVVTGLTQPTEVRAHGGVLLVAQQAGELLVVDGAERKVWLDLAGLSEGLQVVAGGERGFLGFDVDPTYAENGRLVLSWTARRGADSHSILATFRTTPGSRPGTAPLVLDTVLSTVKQPWNNHNGGGVRFGPDGKLYYGLGDGGQAGDPLGSGQDRSTLLGAMLRLDPDLPAPHVPPDNPFVGVAGVRPEIFAYGLRNPWRFAFTPAGTLIAGDVGQNDWEEITAVPKGGNLGWNVKEGRSCFGERPCDGDFVEPYFVYSHADGFSVTGGVVGRSGSLAGRYVFGDYGGHLWSVRLGDSGTPDGWSTDHGRHDVRPSSFALSADGGILLVDHGGGRVLSVSLVQ